MSIVTYTQANQPMSLKTPLGPDNLLLIGLSAREAISQAFELNLSMLAPNLPDITFEKILGQKVSVTLLLPNNQKRYFHGIVKRFSQGHRDDEFTSYRMEVVPQFWLLSKRTQSRIFQQVSVPDILKKVLEGLDVAFEIQGTFQPRDYCVQYRESDFNFASRLMEEEGIFYFFKHTADKHTMVLANTPQSNPDLAPANLIFDEMTGGGRGEDRVHTWEKEQEIRSGKTTLWDHCFELPHKHLEAEKVIVETVKAGTVDHNLRLANEKLELYDFPGAYAQRFDGVGKGGGDQAGNLQKIFEDNARTTGIRMQEEAAPSVVIHGSSDCKHLCTGFKFTLQRHFNADGKYLLTSIDHAASMGSAYRSGDSGQFDYGNAFTCIPADVVFRPHRFSRKPVVEGSQTAVVVGPAGEEIFTDKYSRVKVQFHWDRAGKNDADSSCWIRVATVWAGKQWGVIHIPRIGQEVVVDFLEGDPDQPIIVGSVYNAEMMPPYALPANKTQSGVKSRSSLSGAPANFNEFRFEDKKGSEQVFLHAEKNSDFETENDKTGWVGHDETLTVDNNRTRTVHKNETITIDDNQTESVGKNRTTNVDENDSLTVGKNRTTDIGVNHSVTVGKNQSVNVTDNDTLTVGKDRSASIGKNDSLQVGKKLLIDVGDEIVIQTGDASIVMKKDGTIKIKGGAITIEGSKTITSKADGNHVIKGSKVQVN